MFENLDTLIDINLKLIFKQHKKELFRNRFVDENEKALAQSLKLAKIMNEKGLIRLEPIKEYNCILTEFGYKINENGGWLKYIIDKKEEDIKEEIFRAEKESIEFKKSKIDLELAEKMLKEYPKTKWFARIGFIIALLLGLKELVLWIIQLWRQ